MPQKQEIIFLYESLDTNEKVCWMKYRVHCSVWVKASKEEVNQLPLPQSHMGAFRQLEPIQTGHLFVLKVNGTFFSNRPFSKMAAENLNKSKLKTNTRTRKSTLILVTLPSFRSLGEMSAEKM